MPQNTTGLLGLNPGKGFSMGFDGSHIVSPTLVSDKFLIPVIMKPISPEDIFFCAPPPLRNSPVGIYPLYRNDMELFLHMIASRSPSKHIQIF